MLPEKSSTSRGTLAVFSSGFRDRIAWLIRVGTAAVLASAVLMAIGCGGDSESEKIAFVSERDGDPEIFVMNTDGSEQIQVTTNGAVDLEPRWSPDKKFLAYISEESGDREINRVTIAGKEYSFERLTTSPGADEMHKWSPDGQRIAFISNRNGQPEIYLMNSNGSEFTRVTSDDSRPHLSGWSPDGQWIAYFLDGGNPNPGIITRNPDGVNVRRLTITEDLDVHWSSDGQRIVFTSIRDGGEELYVMNADGSAQTRLTHNEARDYQPAWSPDGTRITFVSDRDGSPEIYVMQADGSAQVRYTQNSAKEESPIWSPDGEKIAFVSYMHETSEIIVMNSDGTNQVRLTNNNTNDYAPAW